MPAHVSDGYSVAIAAHTRILKHITVAHLVALDLIERDVARNKTQVLPPPARAKQPRRPAQPAVLCVTNTEVRLGNGHILGRRARGLQCSRCRRVRATAAPARWKPPCDRWFYRRRDCGAECPPAVPSTANRGGLDDGEFDFDAACEDQALEHAIEELGNGQVVVSETQPLDGLAGGPIGNGAVPPPGLDQSGIRRIVVLPVRNGDVIVGGGSAHITHTLRFVGQYVWCDSCGKFCSGRESRLLSRPCLQRSVGREEALRNLRGGRMPRGHLAALTSCAAG